VRTFQRGSVHAHSIRSDGDAPADKVVESYRRLGYQFATLTDHNQFFDPSEFSSAEGPDFVLLPGEEISMAGRGALLHVNALCTEQRIGGHEIPDLGSGLQWAIDQVRAQGGVALINHPNWRWTLEPKHVAATQGAALFEIYSGYQGSRSEGSAEHSSTEDQWQSLLLDGSTLAPAAVDDAHTYLDSPSPLVEAPSAYPGAAWLGVFGGETSREAICHGLAEGRLYASAGPRLRRLTVQDDRLTLWPEDPSVLVEFITSHSERDVAAFPESDPGAPDAGSRASYRLAGPERFVRARLTAADGTQAWTAAYPVVR
jgi:hypothetical protein